MKIVLNVADESAAELSLSVLTQFGLQKQKLHVAANMAPETPEIVQASFSERMKEFKHELQRSYKVMSCDVRFGACADILVQRAMEEGASLIVSSDCPHQDDRTARNLCKVLGENVCSVMITRPLVKNGSETSALYLTDHSAASLSNLRSFFSLALAGIDVIHVIVAGESCTEFSVAEASSRVTGTIPRGLSNGRTLIELNRALIEQLNAFGYQADARAIDEDLQVAVPKLIERLRPSFLIDATGRSYSEEELVEALTFTRKHNMSLLYLRSGAKHGHSAGLR